MRQHRQRRSVKLLRGPSRPTHRGRRWPPPGPAEEDVDRALEQTLVSQGALVLAPFTDELTPEVSWAHWDTVTNPTLDNSYSAGLGFRMGLPWRSQISLGVPYVWNDFGRTEPPTGWVTQELCSRRSWSARVMFFQDCSDRLVGPRQRAAPVAPDPSPMSLASRVA